ncbi:hypothetical protein JCM3770_000026 [Rhodotorula araucariae]
MLRLSAASSILALVALARVASAQTAAQVNTEQQTLATVISGDCSAQCTAWLLALGQCPGAADAAYSACVCDATFVSDFQTCSACLATDLTSTGDATNAATAADAPGDLTGYCATAGAVVVSSTSSTSALVSSTSALVSSTSATVPVVAAGSSSSSSSSSTSYTVPIPSITQPVVSYSTSTSSEVSLASGESAETTNNIVTLKLTAAGQPFPTQSKGTSAFTNAAAGSFDEARRVAATVIALGVVAGGMMLV